TALPDTIENIIIPIIEKHSGKKSGTAFHVCSNPEFLREGTAIHDFFNPPKLVIGSNSKKTADIIENIYKTIECPAFKTDIKTAEMIKYADNSFHGLKVCFANEIGNICKSEGIDSHKVMDIFCRDTKLNLSPYYLKPGFAFGGSCIPKDLRAILCKAKNNNLKLPLLESILESNENQIKRAIKIITRTKKKNIGILGLSFKAKTDDLRESPIIEVIETLIGKGCNIKIYDSEVMLSSIFGANKDYITKEIPHIHRLFCSTVEEVVNNSELIIISKSEQTFKKITQITTNRHTIIDMVRLFKAKELNCNYEGIC
ncbi:MAG: nucleotide sugar dehydrogenase, partial [archaeon]|nr:nucleotide sugar dehydrogenase [archaeon]